MERRRYPRFSIILPLECWKMDDSRLQAGVSGDLSEMGLSIYSIKSFRVGEEFKIRVFFANEYEFDSFEMFAKILWKDLHTETDWKGYKYGLKLSRISDEDQVKLRQILYGQMVSGDISGTCEGSHRTPPLYQKDDSAVFETSASNKAS